MTPEQKLEALKLLLDLQKAFYKEVDGGPSHVLTKSTLDALKILFPNGLE